jgi:hypothetical protein
MHKNEFLNLSKNAMQADYNQLDYMTLEAGDLLTIYNKTKSSQLLHHVLAYRPELINDKFQENTLLELIVNNSQSSIIERFAQYVDGTVEVNNKKTILGLLIRKSELSVANKILDYYPNLINQQEPNGTYIVELLADKNCSSFLSNRASYIDLSLNTTDNINIATYLIKKEMGHTLDSILAYKPQIINSQNKNGSYVIQSLIDKGYITILSKYARNIEPDNIMTNGKTVIGYLCHKNYSNAIKDILAYYPKSINKIDANNVYVVEQLADKEYGSILNDFSRHIDLSLPASNGKNLLGYLIQKELANSVRAILSYFPKTINEPGPNGVYPVEYLADKGYASVIREFARHIDLSLPASNGKNLLCYLIQKDLSSSFNDVLAYFPDTINIPSSNGVYPVEYLADKGFTSIINTYARHVQLDKPSSKGKTLAGYLVQKGLSDSLRQVLQYYPNSINTVGPNGVHTAEYIADAGYSSLLRDFGKYITLSHITTTGKTLQDYITQKTNVILQSQHEAAPTRIAFSQIVNKALKKKELPDFIEQQTSNITNDYLPSVNKTIEENKIIEEKQPLQEKDALKDLEQLFTSMSSEQFEKMSQQEQADESLSHTEDSKQNVVKKIRLRL